MEDYPELFKRVKDEVNKKKNSRFLALGATWVEMDGNLCSAEAFCRHFLLGQNFFKEHFGAPSEVFWLPDTFGYSGQLPQIASHFGCKYFVSQKLSWNLINKPPHTSFHWRGIDGCAASAAANASSQDFEPETTQLLAHFPPQDNYCCQVTVDELVVKSAVSKQNRDLGRADSVLLLFGDGDGGGGPKEPLLDRLDRFEQMTTTPLRLASDGSPTQMLTELAEKDRKLPQLQTHVGELYFEMHRGTFSVHRRLKDEIAQLEDLLRIAESAAAAAAFISRSTGGNYQHPTEELWTAWNDVLITQFHDAIPGSSITAAYVDLFNIVRIAFAKMSDLVKNASAFIAAGSSINAKTHILNMCPVAIGNLPPFSVGYTAAPLKLHSAPAVNITEDPSIKNRFTVSNSSMTCRVEADGRITLYEKKHTDNAINYVGGENGSWLHWNLYEDQCLFWDAWDVEIYHLEKPLMPNGATVIKPTTLNKETNELVTELSVLHDVVIEQRLVFDSSSGDITVKVSVKNWANKKSKHRILKCLFGCNIVNPNGHFGTAFGAVQRPTHRNSSQELAKFEVCQDRWTDFSEAGHGLSIVNNCGMRGISIHGSVIHLSVLRAPTAPDPTCDEGTHDIEFVLHPHSSSHYSEAGTVDLAASLSKPFVVDSKAARTASSEQVTALKTNAAAIPIDTIKQFISVSYPRLHVTALKLPQGFGSANSNSGSFDVIVRLYENLGSHVTRGKKIELFPGCGKTAIKSITATLCDGLENNYDSAKAKLVQEEGSVSTFILPAFKPFQIRTIKFSIQ